MLEDRKTSIIILTYNNLEYNKICLDSIREYTTVETYEIIIVDNNSTDGTREWLREQQNIKLILNDENVGFPKGCNQAIEIADKANDILFLNNDTIVTSRWLENLKICLYSDEKIGATASVANICSNCQTIEATYTNLQDMAVFATNNNISSPEKWEQKPRLIAFCMLVKREVINKIGGFDERFTPGNFEDDDLCMRIIDSGYKLMLCNDSFIHHFGSTSFKKDYLQFNNVLRINAEKFKEKWSFNSNTASLLKFDVLNFVNEAKDKELNILEFDCTLAATLLRLKYLYPKANLYGIEKNKSIAKISKKIIAVTTKDFEENYTLGFDTPKKDFFDYIILGNRLQLSKNPWKLLKEIKKFLKPGGYVIATIPNAINLSVIKDILKGRLMYGENSVLNKNHNSLFTLLDIYQIFQECGYVTPFVFHYYRGLTEEESEFLKKIVGIAGENMGGHFFSYEYVAKFQRDISDGTEDKQQTKEEKLEEVKYALRRIENDINKEKSLSLIKDYYEKKEISFSEINKIIGETVISKNQVVDIILSCLECVDG